MSLLQEVGSRQLTEIMVWIQLPGSENDQAKVGLTHDHQITLVTANQLAPARNPRVSLGPLQSLNDPAFQIFHRAPQTHTPVAKNL